MRAACERGLASGSAQRADGSRRGEPGQELERLRDGGRGEPVAALASGDLADEQAAGEKPGEVLARRARRDSGAAGELAGGERAAVQERVEDRGPRRLGHEPGHGGHVGVALERRAHPGSMPVRRFGPRRSVSRRAGARRGGAPRGGGGPASSAAGRGRRRAAARAGARRRAARGPRPTPASPRTARAAASAGPRRSASARTTTVQRRPPRLTSTVSPGRTSFAGFTRAPPTWTWPPSTASVAAPRVLKKRAAHSHLSIRTASMRADCRRWSRRRVRTAVESDGRCLLGDGAVVRTRSSSGAPAQVGRAVSAP